MKNFSRNKKLKMHVITLNSEFSTLNKEAYSSLLSGFHPCAFSSNS